LPPNDEQAPFHMTPPVPFAQFIVNRKCSSDEDVLRPPVQGTGSTSSGGHLSGPGVPGVSPSFPRVQFSLPPMPASSLSGHPPHLRPPSNGHGSAHHSVPSQDFTFKLQVPEASYGGTPYASRNGFPHPHRLTASPPHLGESRSQRMSFGSDSRPQTPRSPLVPQGRIESARDLPRLHIPPLHVPGSPHVRQRSSLAYSPPQDPVRAVFSTTSSPSRCGNPSTASLARRFDPVREAASDRSGAVVSTALHIDTPHA
jgi:hypothetical protein